MKNWVAVMGLFTLVTVGCAADSPDPDSKDPVADESVHREQVPASESAADFLSAPANAIKLEDAVESCCCAITYYEYTSTACVNRSGSCDWKRLCATCYGCQGWQLVAAPANCTCLVP